LEKQNGGNQTAATYGKKRLRENPAGDNGGGGTKIKYRPSEYSRREKERGLQRTPISQDGIPLRGFEAQTYKGNSPGADSIARWRYGPEKKTAQVSKQGGGRTKRKSNLRGGGSP